MAWNPYFLLFGGCPPHKKMCQLWNEILKSFFVGASYGMEPVLPIFIWMVFPQLDAISGITGFLFPVGCVGLKKKVPVMA